MAEELKFLPTRSYAFELTIKGKQYTQDLYNVRITSSIVAPYQVIVLDVFVDSNDIIMDKVYGQDPCNLIIWLLGQDGQEADYIKLDLLIIDLNIPLSSKTEISMSGQKERTPLTITTVIRPAFKTITTIVNEVYEEPITVKEVIEDLVSKIGASIQYDSDKQNTEKIEQLVVPPTTLYKAIRYLDNTFGLYDGVPVYCCDYENKVHIMNLSSRMKRSQTFTVDQLAIGSDSTEAMKKSTDGNYFYTYDTITTQYKGNATYAVLAKNLKYIVKPRDTLFHIIEHDLDTICGDYGLISKIKRVPIDTNISHRETYYINHTGYEYNESFAISAVAKMIASMSTISINLEKNLPILNLITVGEPVKFKPRTVEYIDFGGKYILKASDLRFKREGEWQAIATIHLVRTTRTGK